ncbi:D-alanine aminotransferase [Salinimonas sp. HHU 13199]|uniref:D-alanine aminotransferase n=1 Tax=Salinimonas profundi TaxID=2729140 RepID=A0ABR8LHZ5_9ALTE|nr:aminotransferase class IV [Salinimonas profundi]MBD3584706.1 D-alanine aminotransferase [Salinimonas profundi]
MSIAFLNNAYLPLQEARISPMDRGFLFGDGIYEVIPTHHGKPVGLSAHLKRMANGLAAIEISNPFDASQWQDIVSTLTEQNATALATPYIGIYLHVSRGVEPQRHHAYGQDITPTVFGYGFAMATPPKTKREEVTGLHVALSEDLRWQRCHIKSTSLLGNVMHYQQGVSKGKNETILVNQQGEITEAASCNVFAVINDQIVTPPLDHQLLPGITRQLVIDSLRKEGVIVRERRMTKQELLNAQEVWLTSSSKEITPVLSIDEQVIGEGSPGKVWEKCLDIYNRYKFVL